MVLIALSNKERRAKGLTTREMAPSSILLILSTSFKVLLMNPAAASIIETTSSFSVSASLSNRGRVEIVQKRGTKTQEEMHAECMQVECE